MPHVAAAGPPPAADTDAPASETARQRWGAATTLGIGYFIAASVTLGATRLTGDMAYFWLHTAVLLPYLAKLPKRQWTPPLVTCGLAAAVSATVFGAGFPISMLFALIVIGEAAFGAMLLQRFLPDGRYLDSVPNVLRLTLLIGGVMPAISAFGGATACVIAFPIGFWHAWSVWFVVHGLGTLFLMPIVVMLNIDSGTGWRASFNFLRNRGNLVLVGALFAVTFLVFRQERYSLLFLPLLPLTLLTFRAGRFGAALGICAVAIIGGTLTLMGHGPASILADNVLSASLFFQFYLAMTVVTILPMAAELNSRKVLLHQLQNSEAMFRLMADRSGDVLLKLDVAGRIRYCSPSISQFVEHDPAALIGSSSLDLVAEEDRIVVAAAHGRALSRPNETFVVEYRAMTANNRLTWFETQMRAIVDGEGRVTGAVSAARDISHRKLMEARLVDVANTDSLTGLKNRRRFDDRLREIVGKRTYASPPGCLAIIDIDFFKRVNDTHGHAAGDDVLKVIAERLQQLVRRNDLVARIGGEEFGVVLWGLQTPDAQQLCGRLREGIAEQQVALGQSSITITVSIGIADIAAHRNISELMVAADAALYRAKADGRNCVRLAA